MRLTAFPKPTGPRDATAREHVGRVKRFRTPPDPATGFCVAVLHDDVSACGRVDGTPFEVGQTYRMLGRWTDHPRWGWQFEFATYAQQEPTGRNGVVAYLTKLCDGIGERRALALYDRYGGDAVLTLRTDPGRVVADGLLSRDAADEAAKALAEASDLESTKLALFDLFHGRGFWANALIKECVARWGARAPDVIKRNPFALMVAELTSAGFVRCDKLWCDLGLPRLRLKRQTLAGWHELHSDTTGDTWIPIERAVRAVERAVGTGGRPKQAVMLGIRARWFRHHRDKAGKLWLAEADRAANERAIADQVVRLGRAANGWPVVGELADAGPSDHQRVKLRAATAGPVGILAGTPGTGKTYTVAHLLRVIMDLYGSDNILVTAPTGKAAVRMTQAMKAARVPLTAMTIHRALGLGKASQAKGERPEFNERNPLPHKWVIVEEASMCDTDILAHLLRACMIGTHVLILGDPYQLPPVGHGAPLRDLIAAGVPCGELTDIRRNAGLIVRACKAIKDGTPIEVADRYDADAGLNLLAVDVPGPAVNERLQVLLERFRQSGVFHPVWQTQVIVAVNDRGDLARNALNTRLQTLLNPDGKQVAGNPFRVGDKIICLKNQKLTAVRAEAPEIHDATEPGNWVNVRDPAGSPLQLYTANGEMGRVEAVDAKVTVARFSEAEHAVRVPMAKAKADGGREDAEPAGGETEKGRAGWFDLGYAVTCHKMQGSEAPCVIVVVDEAGGRVASKEWHYTALSRASKLCVLIGPRAVMERQSRRVTLKRRKTFLVELVKEGMANAEPRDATAH